jgi:YVTN family beta-propeller protein
VICNQQDHNVYLARLSDGKVVRKIPTGFGPHEAAVSPSGKLIAVSNYGTGANAQGPGNSLTLIKLPEGEVVKTVSTGDYKRPHGISWLNDKEVFVSSETNQALILVNVDSEKVVRAYPTAARGSHMLAVNPATNRVYSANIFDGTITAFELDSAKNLGNVKVGQGSEGVGVSPDGKFVWTGNRDDNTVTVVDTKKMEAVATLESPGLPYRIYFSPDGSRVLVPCPVAGELAVFDAASRKVVKRISMNGGSVKFTGQVPNPGPVGAAFHPNGKIAYCSVQMSAAVAIVDLEKLAVIGQIEAGKSPDGLAVSTIEVK